MALLRMTGAALAAWIVVSSTGCGNRTDHGTPLQVFAAASLAPPLSALSADLETALGFPVHYSFAASSTLARQIDAGAPADVFVSANPVWADWLEERERFAPGSRRDGPGNSLVVIAPRAALFEWSASGDAQLADAFRGRLAIGDPTHVPAGMYARQALRHAGQWSGLNARLVATLDVRASLALVERGECAAGIVYRSDAMSAPDVQVVAPIPEDWHDPVRYVMGAVAGADTARARAWLDAMAARPVARKLATYGFRVPTTAEEP